MAKKLGRWKRAGDKRDGMKMFENSKTF